MSDLHSYLEDGNTLQDYSVQRDSTIHIQLLGTYDDNGFRTDGPGYQPAELDDRTYQIKNAGNLYWFAEFLAAGGKGAEINAELTADITIPAGWTWTPIGLEEDGGSNAYTGTFDGQGHTIRGLATAGQEGGLFWAVSANGTVKNLGLTEGSFTGGAGDCVGAIAGRSSGTIENCYSTCTVTGETGSAGGICGTTEGSAVLKNCYNTGSVTGAGTAGGICGSVAADTVRISGCYNTGTLSAPDAAHGIACCTGDVRYDTVVQAGSCFYLAEQEDGTGGKTAAQFASGLVAWLLQNRQSAPVWGQTVGTDASPVLTTDASRKVIRITVQDMTKGPGATELLWANAGRPVGWEEACTYYGEAACTTEVPRDRTFDGDTTLYAIRWAAVTKAPAANQLTCNGQAQPLVTAGTATGGTLQYSLWEEGGYTTAIPTGTDAGPCDPARSGRRFFQIRRFPQGDRFAGSHGHPRADGFPRTHRGPGCQRAPVPAAAAGGNRRDTAEPRTAVAGPGRGNPGRCRGWGSGRMGLPETAQKLIHRKTLSCRQHIGRRSTMTDKTRQEARRVFLVDTLKKLLGQDSPTGFTDKVVTVAEGIARELGFATRRTNKGNLVITVPGREAGRKVGLCAHVDTLGLMVRSITAESMLMVTKVGGPLLPTLDGEYCRIYTRDGQVYTGTVLRLSPSVHVQDDAATRPRDEKNMAVRIDEKVHSKEDVQALGIAAGDYVCYDPKTTVTDSGFVKSRFLDDKASASCLLTLLCQMHKTGTRPRYESYFTLTVHEEVGHGGATLPAVDELLAVDMGCIGEDLGCTEYQVSICAKDSGGPYDYGMVSRLVQLAKDYGVDHSVDIYPHYGSDVGAAWGAGMDCRAALIGPGVHASHGMERTYLDGLRATLDLASLYLDLA